MTQLTENQRAFLKRYIGAPALGQSGPVQQPPVIAVNAHANEELSQLAVQDLIETDLTQADPNALFEDDYMLSLTDTVFKGEGDPKLKDLMRAIRRGVGGSERESTMVSLAQIVGIPPTAEALDVDYGRFLVVQKQQQAIAVGKDDSAPDLDEDRHPDFMASRGQLMFGKVLGDAFGIHEVFGSLLSPTGGLVGANNNFAPGFGTALHLDPDNPIALHGVVHDAAGYLNTFHNQGPGYNYLDNKLEILGPDSPFSGQVSGVLFWIKEVGDDYLVRKLDDAFVAVDKKLKSVRDAISKRIDGFLGKFGRSSKTQDSEEAAGLRVAAVIDSARQSLATVAPEPDALPQDPLGSTTNTTAKETSARTSRFVWR